MKKVTERILRLAQADQKGIYPMFTKLVEEVGELSEAINHIHGYLPHKVMKEQVDGEIADVIQCTIALYAKLYPGMTVKELRRDLDKWLDYKTDKWEGVMTFHPEEDEQ